MDTLGGIATGKLAGELVQLREARTGPHRAPATPTGKSVAQLLLDPLDQIPTPSPMAPLTGHRIGIAQAQLLPGRLLEEIRLLRRSVKDVQQEICSDRLLQGSPEGIHELMGELADKAHRVSQQMRAAAETDRAGRRVKRMEETVAHLRAGAGARASP